MNCRKNAQAAGKFDHLAAIGADRQRPFGEALRRGCAERHDHPRRERLDFVEQPAPADPDLAGVRPLVQPPLAALRELEMLHRIGDIDPVAGEAGLAQRAIEKPAGRPDKGPADPVFLIAWLLADKDDRGVGGTFAEDRLGRARPEGAGAAMSGVLPQFRESFLGDRGRAHGSSVLSGPLSGWTRVCSARRIRGTLPNSRCWPDGAIRTKG